MFGKFLYYVNVVGFVVNLAFFSALHTWYNAVVALMNLYVIIFCTFLLED